MFETKSDEHVLADDNICISGVIYFHLKYYMYLEAYHFSFCVYCFCEAEDTMLSCM